jgi:hypothetical protein
MVARVSLFFLAIQILIAVAAVTGEELTDLSVAEVHISPGFLQLEVLPIGGLSEAIEVQIKEPVVVHSRIMRTCEGKRCMILRIDGPWSLSLRRKTRSTTAGRL